MRALVSISKDGKGGGGRGAVGMGDLDHNGTTESCMRPLADNPQIQTGTATPGEGREEVVAQVSEEAVATVLVGDHESSESIVRI